MTKFTFKIGDVIRLKRGVSPTHNFRGEIGKAEHGKKYVISARGFNRSYGELYSVKGAYIEDNPNWYCIEKDFELSIPDLKQLVEEV